MIKNRPGVYYLIGLLVCFFLYADMGMAMARSSSSSQSSSNIRALHIVVRGVTVNEVESIIDLAEQASFNTIVFGICWRESLKLDSMPWVNSSKAWTRDDLLSVVDYARSRGMEVVPHIPLLSHQKVLLKKPFPELMYNGQTYDPRDPRVYEIVLPILGEVIDLIQPKAFLIGHDEVIGWKEKHYENGLLKDGEKILPADLFLEDTLILHSYLKSKGVVTWMWGDMLISPDEFPEMLKAGLHGSARGYGKKLRRDIPRDIVICDWHYFDNQKDFPSTAMFKQEGFRVLGSPWKKERTIHNFSRSAARNGADGMLATTWFHVPNKEWDIVDRIIEVSGDEFLRNFPDER